MTPAEFTTEIAIPTAIEFRDEPMSRRRAYLACIVAFHMKDHLRQAGESGIENAMRASCGGDAFDVVRSICNATKHPRINASHTIPFKAGQDWTRPPAVAGMLECGVSRLGDAVGGREISSPAGSQELYWSVRAVLLAYEQLSRPT